MDLFFADSGMIGACSLWMHLRCVVSGTFDVRVRMIRLKLTLYLCKPAQQQLQEMRKSCSWPGNVFVHRETNSKKGCKYGVFQFL